MAHIVFKIKNKTRFHKQTTKINQNKQYLHQLKHLLKQKHQQNLEQKIMHSTQRCSFYLSESQNQSLFSQNEQLHHITSSYKRSTRQNSRQSSINKQKHRQQNFFHDLEVDDDYDFDIEMPTTDSLSKKSLKLIKMLKKQKQHNLTNPYDNCLQQKETINPQKVFGFQFINEDMDLKNDEVIVNLDEDIESISSISCKQQSSSQCGSVDSTWMKIINHNLTDFNQLNDHDTTYRKHSPKKQGQAEMKNLPNNDIVKNKSQNMPQNHKLKKIAQIQKTSQKSKDLQEHQGLNKQLLYKPSSLYLKASNRYLRKYFNSGGLVICPQYSLIVEDNSALAVQGKELRMKGTVKYQSNKQQKRRRRQQISDKHKKKYQHESSDEVGEQFLKSAFGSDQFRSYHDDANDNLQTHRNQLFVQKQNDNDYNTCNFKSIDQVIKDDDDNEDTDQR